MTTLADLIDALAVKPRITTAGNQVSLTFIKG